MKLIPKLEYARKLHISHSSCDRSNFKLIILIDRALGIVYLNGLWEGIQKPEKS